MGSRSSGVPVDQELVDRLVRRSFRSYARYWMEGARLPRTPAGEVDQRMMIESGREHLDAGMAAGRGVVMALPHVGSWEWGGSWLAHIGYPMTAVAERIEPPELFDWFVEERRAMGLTIVPLDSDASGTVLRILRDGGLVGLLCDRDLTGNGVAVDFFGERTTFPAGPALLAMRAGADAHRRGRLQRSRAPAPGGPVGPARPVAHQLDAPGRGPGDPGPGGRVRDLHPSHPRAVAPLPAQLAERPRGRGGPVRVAMVSPYSLSRPGGVQGQVTGLARALDRLGHPVTVLAPDDRARPGRHGDVVVIGRSTGVRANGSVAPLALSPAAAWRALDVVRRSRVDVVHLHEPLAPVAGYGCLLAGPAPMVGTFHRAGDSAAYRVMGPVARWAAGRLGARCAVSEEARRTAVAVLGGDCQVLFNGVDVGRFADAVPWPADRPTVVFLGRHEDRKGLGVLLDAFATLPGPAQLWVAGDGPLTAELARRHPPSADVQWLGVLGDDELAARVAGADVLCAPSLAGESFGLVLLEAMAAGTAVVASDLAGYRMAAGGLADLVPPGDVAALATALRGVLADAPAERGRSSPEARAARRARAEAWSLDELARRYLEIYDDLRRPGPPAGGQ